MPSSFPLQPLALPILPGNNRPLLMEALHRPSRSVAGRTWVQLALKAHDEADGGFLAGEMFALDAN
jgi:hypothetical protein